MKKNYGLLFLLVSSIAGISFSQEQVNKYEIFEVVLEDTVKGNPFKKVELTATFKHEKDQKVVRGFYDGDGRFIIRFLPHLQGEWTYKTISNIKRLNNKSGKFNCLPASDRNHGLVRVKNNYHFSYDDDKPFYPFGTTCYAWIHQPDKIQQQTLNTLQNAPFNKIRMCVFPKWYEFNDSEPQLYPFHGTAPDKWDFSKFNPQFFDHLEKRISQLDSLNIECDLILFHPYDGGHWGFDRMSDAQDDFYLRYIIARLAAYKNIWWSLANEFDFMDHKQMADWDRFFEIIAQEDPYNHLRSIHNGLDWYDHSNPLVTHLSIQQDPWQDGGVGEGPQKIDRWKEEYEKPVIIDEMKYEGNIRYSYGDLTAKDMTSRFWYTITKGAYATHGETYMNDSEIIWWAKGGQLIGQSPSRIQFLREIIESAPEGGYQACLDMEEDGNAVAVGQSSYLFYFGARQPSERFLKLPEDKQYKLEIIDTWEMTITALDGIYNGNCIVRLPGKAYIAVRAISN